MCAEIKFIEKFRNDPQNHGKKHVFSCFVASSVYWSLIKHFGTSFYGNVVLQKTRTFGTTGYSEYRNDVVDSNSNHAPLLQCYSSTMKMKPQNTHQSKFVLSSSLLIHIFDSSRMMEIQGKMTERAIELLNLPPDSSALILDIG